MEFNQKNDNKSDELSFFDSFAGWFEDSLTNSDSARNLKYLKDKAEEALAHGDEQRAETRLEQYREEAEQLIDHTATSASMLTRFRLGLIMSIGKTWRDGGKLWHALDMLREARLIVNHRPKWPSVVKAIDIESRRLKRDLRHDQPSLQ